MWEDDPTQLEEPDLPTGANKVSLIEAQNNFVKFGACNMDKVPNARKVNMQDVQNPLW